MRAACSLAALTALVVATATACSRDQRDDSSTPSIQLTTPVNESTTTSEPLSATSTTSPTSSTSSTIPTTIEPQTPEVDHQEIVDRYVGYWKARFDANSGTPNPDHPALAEYATGSQLDAVIAETQANLEAGVAFVARDDGISFQKVTVISADGNEATVQECVVDDGLLVQRDTGETLNDNISTHNVRGRLVRVEGKWRVAGTTLVQRWEGVAGCALGS